MQTHSVTPVLTNLGALPLEVVKRLACPTCRAVLLSTDAADLSCSVCGSIYHIRDDVVDLRPRDRQDHGEEEAWSSHWSDENHTTFMQRFFSFYRTVVFARTVAHFVNQYLPQSGVLIEAGSGTSETSIRIGKYSGARLLVAVDLIPSVLTHCDPVMDVRISGDIFRLPFGNESVDGVWNVGVMEHFTASEIDQILSELYRVLRPGGRAVLLWPGTDSVPQKMLRMTEAVINFNRRAEDQIRFHPAEISKLPSIQKGQDVLNRNGFRFIHGDAGARSLFAFKVIVGEK